MKISLIANYTIRTALVNLQLSIIATALLSGLDLMTNSLSGPNPAHIVRIMALVFATAGFAFSSWFFWRFHRAEKPFYFNHGLSRGLLTAVAFVFDLALAIGVFLLAGRLPGTIA